MDVVEESKPRVEREIVIMHDDEVELLTPTGESQAEQTGAQTMIVEVGSPLVQKKVKSSLSTPQNDEVSQVVETASTEGSPQSIFKSEAPVIEEKALPVLDPQEETRYAEEFGVVKPASTMRLQSEIHATEEGVLSDTVQTESEETKYAACSRIERKFSCSVEASVDVHSEDSEERDTTKDFVKTVSIVDHALQKNSDEFAGVAEEVETEPTSAAKWSHEVSVDVFIPDEWVEVEMHSVAEPEASTADMAPSFESYKPSPSGLVCVEPVNSDLITEHEAPPAIGVIELEKQGRELISESLDIEDPITGTGREMASPNSIGTQIAFEKRKSMNLHEQPLPDSVEREANHANECETTSQDLQAFPVQDAEASKDAVPTSSKQEDIDLRVCPPRTSGEADKSMAWEFVPTQVERTFNVAESSSCTSESPVLADVELTCERTTDVDSNQVKSTVRVPSFADWERVIEVDAGTTDTMVEELELTSAPPKQAKGIADIREQVHRIWSLKNLKKRPLVEPRTVTEQAVRPVKPKAPKLVGLPWPPMPLTSADDKHCVDVDDAFTSPRQRVAESVGATDTIVAEPNVELLESASSPSEQSEGMDDGAEANIKEQHLRRLWSLKYLKTRPVMVEPRTVTRQILKPVKLKAPKVVGLSWPPAPLITAPVINGVFT